MANWLTEKLTAEQMETYYTLPRLIEICGALQENNALSFLSSSPEGLGLLKNCLPNDNGSIAYEPVGAGKYSFVFAPGISQAEPKPIVFRVSVGDEKNPLPGQIYHPASLLSIGMVEVNLGNKRMRVEARHLLDLHRINEEGERETEAAILCSGLKARDIVGAENVGKMEVKGKILYFLIDPGALERDSATLLLDTSQYPFHPNMYRYVCPDGMWCQTLYDSRLNPKRLEKMRDLNLSLAEQMAFGRSSFIS